MTAGPWEDSGGLGESSFRRPHGWRVRQRGEPGGGSVAGLGTVWTGTQRPPRCCQEGLNKAPAVLLLLLMMGVWEPLVVLERRALWAWDLYQNL